MAYDAEGAMVMTFAPAWARDADGRDVPTHYEITGTTLVQVVAHRGGAYTYGITADPFGVHIPNPFKIAKCAAVVAVNFFAGSNVYKLIKALGGPVNAAKLLVKAGDIHDFIGTVGTIGAAVIGIDSIRKACF